jgi:hypothetical protein
MNCVLRSLTFKKLERGRARLLTSRDLGLRGKQNSRTSNRYEGGTQSGTDPGKIIDTIWRIPETCGSNPFRINVCLPSVHLCSPLFTFVYDKKNCREKNTKNKKMPTLVIKVTPRCNANVSK